MPFTIDNDSDAVSLLIDDSPIILFSIKVK